MEAIKDNIIDQNEKETVILSGPFQSSLRMGTYRDGIVFRPEKEKWIEYVGTIAGWNKATDGLRETDVHVIALHVLTKEEKDKEIARLIAHGYHKSEEKKNQGKQ